GVKVSEKDKVVRITKFAADSPLLKAGVEVDDIVTKVNGTLIPSAEELRRTLRDALATKGEATITVRRGEKTTDIRVPLE
ncbi:MAG: PDZ domain-containing protein, partial [Planctomycetia bacterium]|nr:PDZ domain-containing protein [Planctomycetia bacterium]